MEQPRTFDEQLADAYIDRVHAVRDKYTAARVAHLQSPTIAYPDGYSIGFRDADDASVYLTARFSGCTEHDAIAAALAVVS